MPFCSWGSAECSHRAQQKPPRARGSFRSCQGPVIVVLSELSNDIRDPQASGELKPRHGAGIGSPKLAKLYPAKQSMPQNSQAKACLCLWTSLHMFKDFNTRMALSRCRRAYDWQPYLSASRLANRAAVEFRKSVAPHSRLWIAIRDQPATPDRSTLFSSPMASIFLPPLPSPEPIFCLPCASQQHMLNLGNRIDGQSEVGVPLFLMDVLRFMYCCEVYLASLPCEIASISSFICLKHAQI